MKRSFQNYLTIAAGLATLIASLPIWKSAKAPVTFVKDVLPILQEKRRTCHRYTTHEMELAWVTIAQARPLA